MSWLSGWSYRKTVSITGQTGAGTDYQVDLSIGDGSGGDFNLESHCTSFPNDIQVTDNDQTTPLDYWIEDLTLDPITMWVEVADDLGSNVDVCVYYGKSGESTVSNGSNTFNFFDDFPGSSLDTSKWDYNGTPVVASSTVSLNDDDTIVSKTKFGFGYAVYTRSKADEQDVSFVAWRETKDNADNQSGLLNTDYYYPDDFDRFTFASEKDGLSGIFPTLDNWDDFRNVWKEYRVKRISGSKTIFEQESHTYTATNSNYIPTVDMGAALSVADSSQESTLISDWIFIKNYNDPEPAFSSAGSEETESAATISVFMHSYRNLRET